MTKRQKQNLERKVRRLTAKGLKVLGLEGWDIKVRVVKDTTLERHHKKPVQGDSETDAAHKITRIRISEDWNDQDFDFRRTLTEFVAHECCHVWVGAKSIKMSGRTEAEEFFCNSFETLLAQFL